jgi:hypothetical protein
VVPPTLYRFRSCGIVEGFLEEGKMKTWTWKMIEEVLRGCNTEGYRGNPVRDVLLATPERYRWALAAAFSVVKWHPELGMALTRKPCGLCELYQNIESVSCRLCPLMQLTGSACSYDTSLFRRAYFGQGVVGGRELYATLCRIYETEYNNLLNAPDASAERERQGEDK